jgi:hypothetical protein
MTESKKKFMELICGSLSTSNAERQAEKRRAGLFLITSLSIGSFLFFPHMESRLRCSLALVSLYRWLLFNSISL